MKIRRKKFDRDSEWPFRSIPKPTGAGWTRRWIGDRDDNDEIFLLWLVRRLRKAGGRALADDERLNGLAMYMGRGNLDHLRDHISSGVYLAHCPRLDSGLADNEVAFDVDEIYLRCE